MSTPLFHEFKKQASFFLKEQSKTARLALTDVTPAQLMTEEATNGNPWGPDSPTLRLISRAAFELEDYWRIVEILQKRLLKFENKNWRASYNSLIVLEHLLTHGPESVAGEFQSDKDVISQMKSFRYIDDRGFNWGLTLRKKSEHILMLLEEEHHLKVERERARKLSRGIQGFGSFSQRLTPAHSTLRQTSSTAFGRCNSDFNNHETEKCPSPSHQGGSFKAGDIVETENVQDSLSDSQMLQKSDTSSKENIAPEKEVFHIWNLKGESNHPLVNRDNEDSRLNLFMEEEDDHPFNSKEMHANASLLSARDGILQGC